MMHLVGLFTRAGEAPCSLCACLLAFCKNKPWKPKEHWMDIGLLLPAYNTRPRCCSCSLICILKFDLKSDFDFTWCTFVDQAFIMCTWISHIAEGEWAKRIRLIISMQCSAGNPSVLAFICMPHDTHSRPKNPWRPSANPVSCFLC